MPRPRHAIWGRKYTAGAAALVAAGLIAYLCVTLTAGTATPHDASATSSAGHSPRPSASLPAGAGTTPPPAQPTVTLPAAASPSHSAAPPSAPDPPPATQPSGKVSVPVTSVPAGNVSCEYQQDTWSGDASSVGYSVRQTAAANGNRASFTVVLNANRGTTEVVGYPSDQCLLYSALPSSLTSSFAVSPPASSSGLDYEYAYDIWLTTATAAKASNWDNDLELMIWTYVSGQRPAGNVVATLSDGSKVWTDGGNTTGIVSVVLPRSQSAGRVDIASVVRQLKSRGYISSADDGILDVEYGIEAPYGGGRAFSVRGLSVTRG